MPVKVISTNTRTQRVNYTAVMLIFISTISVYEGYFSFFFKQDGPVQGPKHVVSLNKDNNIR